MTSPIGGIVELNIVFKYVFVLFSALFAVGSTCLVREKDRSKWQRRNKLMKKGPEDG